MISEEEVKALMLAMKKRYGLDFTNYEVKSLNRGITRLMTKHKMKGMIDLWGKILKDDDFFTSSIDDLLVNLTELFRNPDAWAMIRDEILPTFSKANEIDIWHAGCSTGEEIYTMAIVLEESNMLFKSNMLATDLSQTALDKAKKGVYSKAALKNYLRPFLKFFPDKSLEDYFEFNDTNANIKKRYTRKVTYKRHNLVELKMDKKFDMIFCRNVMIYFDSELKSRILNFLNNCLKDGGYLVLGYYDTMPNESIDIFDVHNNSTRIYKKRLTPIRERYEQESVNS
ncbi:MAG: protein-glutamate O-methyltransferase CheR [Reichenbachiella sp.]|uniref:CheR family methyltransferase n=1 Tax=Reichenbachiella sp. TaxID=2184521 RepID=UPI003264C9B4